MGKSELKIELKQFKNALERFRLAMRQDVSQNDLLLDGTIQRFEFCYDLCWKTLRSFLLHEGIDAKTPRSVFQESFKLGWLKGGDELWTRMIDDRNMTSHTYDQQKALEVYGNLGSYLSAFETLVLQIESLI